MTTPYQPHEHYYIGTEIVLRATFVNREDVPTNPSIVTCRVKKPDGTVEDLTPAPTLDTGIWEAYYTIEDEGKHWYRYEGSGLVTAAAEKPFQGLEQMVPEPVI